MGVAHVSASFSAILRVRLPDEAGTFGRVATAIGEQGALLGAIDLVRIETAHKVRDVTILAEDEAHIERVAAAVNALAGVEVEAVSGPHVPQPPRRQARDPLARAAEDP